MSILDAAIRNVQRAEARLIKLQDELECWYKLPPGDFRSVVIAMTRAEIKRGVEALHFHAECVEANQRWVAPPSPQMASWSHGLAKDLAYHR